VEAYCRAEGLCYVTDSTNADESYARNRLRHMAMPALESVNPAYLRAAGRMLGALRQDADYLDTLASGALRKIELGCQDGTARYSRAGYLGLALPIRMRALLRLFAFTGAEPDTARLQRLDALIAAGTGAEQIDGYVRLVAAKREFRVEKGAPPEKMVGLVQMDYEHYEEKVKSQPTLLNNALDCARIDGILSVRNRLPGDTFRPAGRGCTKTLKNLCQEKGIPPIARECLKILADSSGIVWAEGLGVAERAAPGPGTKKVTIVELYL
jgi:tRNA(Ile)-lysidine synthase